jgi:hypothetical protein
MPVTIVGNNTPTAGGVVYGDGTNYASTSAGTSGQILQSNGSSAPSWATITSTPTIVRSARTSNTILGTADASKLIAITSGTFTQTFTAAATLGSGWFCYIQNAGTGDITLDPNSSETIDGLTSYIMYPGEVRLVQCDGTAFYTVVLDVFYRTFTSSATFTTPPGYGAFGGFLYGGGGGGGRSSTTSDYGGGGGGGGACVPFTIQSSLVSSSVSITVGAGGTGATLALYPGTAGGTTSFGSYVSAYGGGGGGPGDTSSLGGGGGGGGGAGAGVDGQLGTEARGGYPAINGTLGTISGPRGNYGLGGAASCGSAANSVNCATEYGGGGGGTSNFNSVIAGGSSLYGGGGGGSGIYNSATRPTGGSSGSYLTGNGAGEAGTGLKAGNGGRGGSTATLAGEAGGAPSGGGGGGGANGSNSGVGGAGARGEVRIWGIA